MSALSNSMCKHDTSLKREGEILSRDRLESGARMCVLWWCMPSALCVGVVVVRRWVRPRQSRRKPSALWALWWCVCHV